MFGFQPNGTGLTPVTRSSLRSSMVEYRCCIPKMQVRFCVVGSRGISLMVEHVAFDHIVGVRFSYALPGGYGVMIAQRVVAPLARV